MTDFQKLMIPILAGPLITVATFLIALNTDSAVGTTVNEQQAKELSVLNTTVSNLVSSSNEKAITFGRLDERVGNIKQKMRNMQESHDNLVIEINQLSKAIYAEKYANNGERL